MTRKSDSGSVPAEATAAFPDVLEVLAKDLADPDKCCQELARLFQVRADEVALYRLEKGFLRFIFPQALRTAGLIPLSSSGAVSAHTASSKKAELFNNFPKVKHASVFEHIKLHSKPATDDDQLPIQKLISVPLLDQDGDVLGVIQVCRKGYDLTCGPDFSLEDLRRLEEAAKVLVGASFMQPDQA
jgi:hypothetical protein